MIQFEVIPGTRAVVRIGTRFARVTVLRRLPGTGRARWACLTDDTRREITATAARLKPLLGSPEEAAEEARAVARRAAEERAIEKARADDLSAELRVYAAAALTYSHPWSAEGLRDHAERWIGGLVSHRSREEARAAILRALTADPAIVTRESWGDVVAYGLRQSAGGHFTAPRAVPGMIRRTSPRPVEMPIGRNLAILANVVGRRHVAESILSVARAVRRSMGQAPRTMPVPLRRGLWQAAAEIHAGNRAVYRDVMGYPALPSPEMVADAVGTACGLGACPR
jgi:hypothetical protein